jgi:hypothetical protein
VIFFHVYCRSAKQCFGLSEQEGIQFCLKLREAEFHVNIKLNWDQHCLSILKKGLEDQEYKSFPEYRLVETEESCVLRTNFVASCLYISYHINSPSLEKHCLASYWMSILWSSEFEYNFFGGSLFTGYMLGA